MTSSIHEAKKKLVANIYLLIIRLSILKLKIERSSNTESKHEIDFISQCDINDT